MSSSRGFSTSKARRMCRSSARSTSARPSRNSSGSTEKAAVTMLNQAIETCRSLGDHGSRDLLEGILKSEEEHANWIEAQLTLIEQAGEGNYLSQQIKSDDD